MVTACGLDCKHCPAASRCGMTCNFCTDGTGCRRDPLRHMDVREAVIAHLGGLELRWPRQIESPKLPDLPTYLPVLVQAYADPVNLPWVAIHGSRLLGRRGQRLTPKHRGRALRDVYRLSSSTRVALEFFVEDRVLEGVSARRREFARGSRSRRGRPGPDAQLSPCGEMRRAYLLLGMAWVALHGARLFGRAGDSLTPKHRRPSARSTDWHRPRVSPLSSTSTIESWKGSGATASGSSTSFAGSMSTLS